MQLKQFITNLAKKAGYDTESAAAKPFFDALPETDMPEEVITGIDNSLISIKDAKNNHGEIAKVYRSQVYDALDKTTMEIFDEMEVPEGVRSEIISENNAFKRLALMTRKIAELKQSKNGADKGDKAAIQKQIDDLQALVRTEKEARAADKAAYDNTINDIKIGSKRETFLSAHKTIYDDLDPEIRTTSINSILNKALQDNQAKFAFDETGNFSLLKNDGTLYYGENHQQITPAQFIEQTLAKNKVLKVSNGQQATPPKNGTAPTKTGGQSDTNPNASVVGLNNQAIADITAAAKQMAG